MTKPTTGADAVDAAPPLTIRGVSTSYDGTRAVDNVTIEVPGGAFLVLLGPSGCGKTTLLRTIAGLEEADAGTIRVGERVLVDHQRGTSLPPGERDLGLVFQGYALWPHMSVLDNVRWPLKVAGWSRSRRDERAREVLELVGIPDLAAQPPGALSGGQQQRVALARTLAPRPRLVLFDEPLSNLDAALRTELRAELVRLHRESGTTSVYVTHDQVEARTMGTHVAVMRAGRVEQLDQPAVVADAPATPFVARFVGSPPAVVVQLRHGDTWAAVGRALDGVAPDVREITACWRPWDVELHAEASPGRLPFLVVESVPVADRWSVAGLLDGRRVELLTAGPAPVDTGVEAWLDLSGPPLRVWADGEVVA